ncbi:Averufin oxidase A [Aspergillus spinulosporus]
MPSYALLGATGATGSSILRHLLHSGACSDLTVNVLVRSKSKLLAAFPGLNEPRPLKPTLTPTIRIFEGDSTSPDVLGAVIQDASLVFMCVAQNGSPMGTTLVQNTAAALIEARRRQPQPQCELTVIQLRSASLNPVLAVQVRRFVHRLVCFCLAAGYDDLRRACTLYEAAATEGLLQYVLVDPPTLHDAEGTRATGYRLIDMTDMEDKEKQRQAICLSYADLGVAMCEIAGRADKLRGQAIGVTATGPVRQTWGVLAGFLLQGGLGHLDYKYGRENIVVVGVCILLLTGGLLYSIKG